MCFDKREILKKIAEMYFDETLPVRNQTPVSMSLPDHLTPYVLNITLKKYFRYGFDVSLLMKSGIHCNTINAFRFRILH